MGCLFALFGGLFPRLGVFIIWVARPALVDAAFHTFILPLLVQLQERFWVMSCGAAYEELAERSHEVFRQRS